MVILWQVRTGHCNLNTANREKDVRKSHVANVSVDDLNYDWTHRKSSTNMATVEEKYRDGGSNAIHRSILSTLQTKRGRQQEEHIKTNN